MNFIPVAKPALIGNEEKYVLDCLKTSWISSIGKYVPLFEKRFGEYIGTKHSLSCSNGTAALHLALRALDIKEGDEVICPVLSFVATANSILYAGAKPVFVDCNQDDYNIDVSKIEEKITPKTKAIIVVHLYGHPCDMDSVREIAKRRNIYVVEDAAEAIGSKYKGKMCGSLSDVSAFSFYGNKTITTGEGGMVCTNSDGLAQKVMILKGQGMETQKRYWFSILGYNYRMTNIQAAIGLGQLENIDKFVEKRREIAQKYNYYLKDAKGIILPKENENVFYSYWMYPILIDDILEEKKDKMIHVLFERGVETRPFFYPFNILPVFKQISSGNFEVSEQVYKKGINLPIFYELKEEEIEYIADLVKKLK